MGSDGGAQTRSRALGWFLLIGGTGMVLIAIGAATRADWVPTVLLAAASVWPLYSGLWQLGVVKYPGIRR